MPNRLRHRLGTPLRRNCASALVCAGLLAALALPLAAEDTPPAGDDPGAALFARQCASCHGAAGEGVAEAFDRPLVGDKSVAELARHIEKYMPEDEPEACVGEDALHVARYVHDAFYSPIAQARLAPPRIELSRLTVRQYRAAVSDLVGSFRESPPRDAREGLRAEYYNSRRPRGRAAIERTDPRVAFDFGRSEPLPEELEDEGFSARWDGSLVAPATGDYELIVRTDHAARLWLNDLETPLIDAWVRSGDDTVFRASIFLIDGRSYPLRLEFTSGDQGVRKEKEGEVKPLEAFLELRWALPHRAPEVIPARQLIAERGPEVFVPATPFPPDDRSIGYERGTSAPKAWDEATTEAAIDAAAYIAEHLEDLAGVRGRDDDAERAAKLREFCGRFVERAFRRPLAPGERELYLDRQFEEAPSPEEALKRVVLLTLKSPRFLYLDLRHDAPDAHDVASRLSFALWDSLPDEELREAASSGELLADGAVERHARRMLEDPRARAKIRQFLHAWLDIEDVPRLAKDAEHFAGFDEDLASDLRTSLDLFLEDVFWGDDPDFRRLFLGEEIHLNGRLAQYYGFELPAPAPFQRVRAADARRLGVLAHPYILARFAYADASSPIHRGVFLVRGVFGRVLRPPPEAFTPLAPELHPDLTTRERVSLQTEPQACQSCHRTINALGFTLEHFDAVGRLRGREAGKVIDASSAFELPTGDSAVFQDVRGLAEYVSTSDEVHAAFIERLFQQLVKQPILAYGIETPERLLGVFVASDYDMRELAVRIAVTDALSGVEAASEPKLAAETPRRPGDSALDPARASQYDAPRSDDARGDGVPGDSVPGDGAATVEPSETLGKKAIRLRRF